MRKKFNLMALLLAFLLSISMLSGCSADITPEDVGNTVIDIIDTLGRLEPDETETDTPADTSEPDIPTSPAATYASLTVADIPAYDGNAWVAINDNQPFFITDDLTTTSFETYGELDELGRCTMSWACVGQDLMPTEERESIGSVKPTGWVNNKYDFVDGKYLYNRCHIIGFQLTGENANKQNLITGTRYLNIEGMLPFENMVADYVHETNNHVLYRVTPMYNGDNLVADGVLMEGWSVEDDGEGICYNVFCYNVQPGVVIDYATGQNWAE